MKTKIFTAFALLIAGLLIGMFLVSAMPMSHEKSHKHFMGMSMDEKREEFILEKNDIHKEMMNQGDYSCCLENACTYCIEKTPGHGEGAECHCLEDIMNGEHPCGECIGEIMEGHGNPYLAKYFAKAIAEEMGEHHTDHLKEMMAEKYDIPVEEQV